MSLLSARTTEAFRKVNAQMKHFIGETAKKYHYAYPYVATGFERFGPYALHVADRRGHYHFCIGIYPTEELLRAGVETVAEFLEEVV